MKIKVAHLLTRISKGGAEKNTYNSIRALDRDRYEVDLIFGADSEQSDIEFVKGLGINVIQVQSLKKNISPKNDMKAIREMRRIFRENSYDIIHTHQSKAGFIGRMAVRRVKPRPYVIHGIHGLSFNHFNPWLKNRIFIFLEKLAARYTDHFTSVSEKLLEIMKHAGIIKDRHKCDVIYSGMDLGKFTSRDETVEQEERKKYTIDDQFTAGMVSKLEPRKNYEDYLKIADYIVNEKGEKKIRFLIVGNGESEQKLKRMAAELGLNEHVVFTGYRSDVERVYSVFDAFVITSLAEGIPQVCVQAAAVGIPVLGYDIDGMSEIIKQDVNGYMSPVREWKTLADHLLEIMHDQDLRDRLSKAGPGVLQGRWDQDRMLDDVKKLYDSIKPGSREP